jgi:tetratricopeptide (TPR) repeat protein
MLNLEEIAQRIAQPEISRVEDIDDLKLFSDKYPYCQLFPILYLKALAQHNDIRFEEELTKYAYCISDRSQLYALIHTENATGNTQNLSVTEEIVSINEAPIQQIATETIQAIEEPVVEEILEPVVEQALEESLPVVEIEEEKVEAEIETPIEVPVEISIDNQEIEPSISPIVLDEEDEEEDFDAEFISLNIRGNEELQQEDIEVPIVEVEPIHLETSTDYIDIEQSALEVVIEEEPVSEVEEQEDPVIEKFEREIFSEAISANYNLDHLAPLEATKIDKEIEEEIFVPTVNSVSGKKSFSSWLRSNENDEQPQFDAEKDRINAIVDQFIKEEPKISRPSKETIIEEKPKKEFFSPIKKAKESLDVHSMPVSETLAKIFALQGNYPKAIFAYEQLILINPEKKIFFASRIEELKKKLNT